MVSKVDYVGQRLLSRRGEGTEHKNYQQIVKELKNSRAPIVVGPFLMELGFELLYWIPFVTKLLAQIETQEREIYVLGRGGSQNWYPIQDKACLEVFDFWSESEFKSSASLRYKSFGNQKQIAPHFSEENILEKFSQLHGVKSFQVLHPSLMVLLLELYWDSRYPVKWLTHFCEYEKVQKEFVRSQSLKQYEVGFKLYSRESLNSTNSFACCVRAFKSKFKHGRSVHFLPNLDIDDHTPFVELIDSSDVICQPGLRNNLLEQSIELAKCQAFMGTYGGFAYLAQYLGVPTVTWEENPRLNRSAHYVTCQEYIKPLSGSSITLLNSHNSHFLFHQTDNLFS
jgi:hypothetical protein